MERTVCSVTAAREERSYLICVDVGVTSVRDAVTSRILRAGSRVQYSVFAVPATPVILAELHRDLKTLIRGHRAHVLIFDVGRAVTSHSRVIELGCTLYGRSGPVSEKLRTPNGWFA